MGTHKNVIKYKTYTVWGTRADEKHGTGTGEIKYGGWMGQAETVDVIVLK